jgi:hypothetical protein
MLQPAPGWAKIHHFDHWFRLELAGEDQQQSDDCQGRADYGEACNRLGMRDLRKPEAFEPVFQPEQSDDQTHQSDADEHEVNAQSHWCMPLRDISRKGACLIRHCMMMLLLPELAWVRGGQDKFKSSFSNRFRD